MFGKIKKKLQIFIISNSFIFKSTGKYLKVLGFIPNKQLNHNFEKPIIPKKFEHIISIKKLKLSNSIKFEKIKNSLVNFNVPGNPKKKIHIIKIQIPRLGVVWSIPDSSRTDLVW
jgi:hypothetical protein